MRRIVLLVALATLGSSGVASACINDKEQPKHEREFRSQYGDDSRPPQTYPQPLNLVGRFGVGGGAALLIGAVAFAARPRRARA